MTEPLTIRWRRVSELLERALDLPQAERPALVETIAEPELRREVESLLANLSAGGETEVAQIVANAFETLEPELPALRGAEGRYQLRREIGRGGFGMVYLADRIEPDFRMPVAVKMARWEMRSSGMLQRLRQERQILAGLRHPFIAQILDCGTSSEGLPYFVMEWVDGEPIDRFCDREKLGVGQRLALFRKVCDAIVFANRRLVVHRDIKPGNVLVTADGTPKLLDFGVAKLLDPEHPLWSDALEGLAQDTQTGQGPFTPGFASPEQVRGEPVTTATDVYALGIVLYQLLTGTRPYEVGGLRPAELERTICEVSPDPPSATVSEDPEGRDRAQRRKLTPGKLRDRLRGDLDTILLKTLRKEPEARYGSAERLAEDLDRLAAALPISARRPSWRYRAGCLWRRQRLAVTLAAATSLALVIGLATTWWQAREAQQARLRADSHLAEVQRQKVRGDNVISFLIDLFEVADPANAQGRSLTADELLHRGAERIPVELPHDPATRAELMAVIGRVYQRMGEFEEAERLVQESLDLSRSNLPGNVGVARHLNTLADILHDRGEYARSRQLFEQALRFQQKLRAQDPSMSGGDAVQSDSLEGLALVAQAEGDGEEAERLLLRAIELRRANGDPVALAETQSQLAAVFFDRGQTAAAKELFDQVLAVQLSELGDLHPDLVRTLNNLAAVAFAEEQVELAAANFSRVVSLRERILGPQHRDLAVSLQNLAVAKQRLGEFEEAERLQRRALEINRQALGNSHPGVAQNLANLGRLYQDLGRLDEAEDVLLRALAIRLDVFGESHPDVDLSRYLLARLWTEKRAFDLAEPMFDKVVERQTATLDAKDPRRAFALLELGRLRLAMGREVEAGEVLRQAFEIRRRALDAGHWQIAEVELELGTAELELGRRDSARELFGRAYGSLRRAFGDQDPRTVAAQELLRSVEQPPA